jgi:hypothetical protein
MIVRIKIIRLSGNRQTKRISQNPKSLPVPGKPITDHQQSYRQASGKKLGFESSFSKIWRLTRKEEPAILSVAGRNGRR